ncbi:hypothetical protein DFH29DRAFT_856319 [Suillus ampliporus]|nr:hypothetical protein DFH29DRAFT_856319 [Suillus ampliporus]
MAYTDKYEVLNDSKSFNSPPPPYDHISAPADSVRCICRRSPILSFLRNSNKQKRTTVLSLIREIVSDPNFTPSSVAPIVNACAAALSPAEFSSLLQKCNIEGHTAMYWAIVNHHREAFSAFAAFIPKFSSVFSSDLRLACMFASDHASFTQLNLGHIISSKDESLKRFLNYPPDELEVLDTGDRLSNNRFIFCARIRMFQKRLCMIRELGMEFVAAGRIWLIEFYITPQGTWRIAFTLFEHSSPANISETALVIEAYTGKPGCTTPPQDLRHPLGTNFRIAPKGSGRGLNITTRSYWPLGDWVMDDNTMYVDREGTLHVKMEITLK